MNPPPARIAAALAVLLAGTTTTTAGELQPDRIAAGSQWFVHVDLDGLRSTDTGKELARQLEQRKGRQFRAFKRMFSVNPLTDLAAVTLQGPGGKDLAVALIEGRFDRAHIEDVIAGAKDYDSHRHGGFTVHEWLDENKGRTQFGTFVRGNLIAISQHRELLHDTLDVLAGEAASAEADPFFGRRGGAVVVAGRARMAGIELDGEESRLLRKADELRVSLAEQSGRIAARLAVDAPDRATAERMRRVLDGLAAFAELAELVGPEVGFKATLDQAGRRAETTMEMPVSEFLDFVDQHGILDEKEDSDDKEGE